MAFHLSAVVGATTIHGSSKTETSTTKRTPPTLINLPLEARQQIIAYTLTDALHQDIILRILVQNPRPAPWVLSRRSGPCHIEEQAARLIATDAKLAEAVPYVLEKLLQEGGLDVEHKRVIAAIDQKISNWDWTMEVGYRAHSRVRTLLAIERVMQVDLFIPGFRICLSETEALVKGEDMRLLNIALRLKRDKHEDATEAALLLEKAAQEDLQKSRAARTTEKSGFQADGIPYHLYQSQEFSENQPQSHSRDRASQFMTSTGILPAGFRDMGDAQAHQPLHNREDAPVRVQLNTNGGLKLVVEEMLARPQANGFHAVRSQQGLEARPPTTWDQEPRHLPRLQIVSAGSMSNESIPSEEEAQKSINLNPNRGGAFLRDFDSRDQQPHSVTPEALRKTMNKGKNFSEMFSRFVNSPPNQPQTSTNLQRHQMARSVRNPNNDQIPHKEPTLIPGLPLMANEGDEPGFPDLEAFFNIPL